MTQTQAPAPDLAALLPAATIEAPGRQPEIGDAFGEMLRDCWALGGARRTVQEVAEHFDGEVRTGDVGLYYFTGPDGWHTLEREVLRRASGRVLDAACRAGTHGVHLAQQPTVREVVGLEFSPGAVEIARERGVDARLGSVHQLPPGLGTFDTIVLFGMEQGALGNAELAPAALRSLAGVAAPGATLIYQGTDPYRARFREPLSRYFVPNQARGRLPGTIRFRVRYQLKATPWFDFLFCSAEEFTRLTEGTGWTVHNIEEDDQQYLVTLNREPSAA